MTRLEKIENLRMYQNNEFTASYLTTDGLNKKVKVNLNVDLEKKQLRILLDNYTTLMDTLTFGGNDVEDQVREVWAYLNLIGEAMEYGENLLENREQLK